MLGNLLRVGGWTLVSRVTGFARDILLAAILGAGPLMDAFTVAFRLPNHFRAIFGEGAFANAFVPAYTATRTRDGAEASDLFHGRVLTLLLTSQVALLVIAMAFTSGFVGLLAPGFTARPEVFAMTVELTRITFPYLGLVTLVTLWSDALNAVKRFSAAAAAPVLLNAAMIATLLYATAFPTPAHAAAWGVFLAGILEAALLMIAAKRAGVLVGPKRPVLDDNMRRFFKAFLPAVIGAGGVQIAMLADTIIVTLLPTGGASSLYYADRLYQLPVGVIGIAAGTVLLPEMARLIAAGDPAGAHRAQAKAMGFTLLLAAPFVAAFIAIPDLIVGGLFGRGAFDQTAVALTAQVLTAYTVGLLAVVLMRPMVSSFTARGDTVTPLVASLTGIGCNLLLKLWFWRSHGAAGLAFATAIGAWINFGILATLALRRRYAAPDGTLGRTVAVSLGAASILALSLWTSRGAVHTFAEQVSVRFAQEVVLALLGGAGALVYAVSVLFGARLLKISLPRRRR